MPPRPAHHWRPRSRAGEHHLPATRSPPLKKLVKSMAHEVAIPLRSPCPVLQRFSSWVRAAPRLQFLEMQLGCLQRTLGVQFACAGHVVWLCARCSARCTAKLRRGCCLHAQGISGSAGTLEVKNDAHLAVQRRTRAFRKFFTFGSVQSFLQFIAYIFNFFRS